MRHRYRRRHFLPALPRRRVVLRPREGPCVLLDSRRVDARGSSSCPSSSPARSSSRSASSPSGRSGATDDRCRRLAPAGRRRGGATRSTRPPQSTPPDTAAPTLAVAAGHPGARRQRRRRQLRRRGRRHAPRHRRPRRRPAHVVLVPGVGVVARRSGRSPAATSSARPAAPARDHDGDGACTSGYGSATATSTRCSSSARPTSPSSCASCLPTSPTETPWSPARERRELQSSLRLPGPGPIDGAATLVRRRRASCDTDIPVHRRRRRRRVRRRRRGSATVSTAAIDAGIGLPRRHHRPRRRRARRPARRRCTRRSTRCGRCRPSRRRRAGADARRAARARPGRHRVGASSTRSTADCSDAARGRRHRRLRAPGDGRRRHQQLGCGVGPRAPPSTSTSTRSGTTPTKARSATSPTPPTVAATPPTTPTARSQTSAALPRRRSCGPMQLEQPGREVDLIAHSQGGVVVDVFLADVLPGRRSVAPAARQRGHAVVARTRARRWRPSASQVRSTRTRPGRARRRSKDVPAVPALEQHRGARPGRGLVGDATRVQARGVPEHFDFTTIGATEDFVVPATNISLPGATETVAAVDEPQPAQRDRARARRAARRCGPRSKGDHRRASACSPRCATAVAPVVISRVRAHDRERRWRRSAGTEVPR